MFTLLLTLAAAATTASAGLITPRAPCATRNIKCPIVFDGRVSTNMTLSSFDSSSTSPFDPDYVKGNNLTWSEILLLPGPPGSVFDGNANQPVEVTLSDKSVFQEQHGFRRAGLLFKNDAGDGAAGNEGVKTVHWSLKLDEKRALNLSHEYLLVWHETNDYSANQFNFELGSILGQTSLPADTWKVLDRSNKQIWSTPVPKGEGVWNNFAVTLDYGNNTLTVYYSTGDEVLRKAAGPVTNDNSGKGQFQLGILKKPTGTSDVVNSGYQESGLNEGLIYGGMFVEDGASGCVSL